MKTYFIVENNAEGYKSGRISYSLEKTLEDIGVEYTEEFEDDDKFGMNTPSIEISRLPKEDKEILIFKIDLSKKGYQELIAQFNFFYECEDDVQDFIQDNYRDIITSVHESTGIKKFKDFN